MDYSEEESPFIKIGRLFKFKKEDLEGWLKKKKWKKKRFCVKVLFDVETGYLVDTKEVLVRVIKKMKWLESQIK